ncbi:MAG: tail fiber protein [Candidatus Baltobacteraceae bacterium]
MYGYPWLLGSLLLLPYDFTPEDFDKCEGQQLPIGDGELFKLLGTQFGGDGTTNFGLPDLRAHEPIKGVKYYIATKGSRPS